VSGDGAVDEAVLPAVVGVATGSVPSAEPAGGMTAHPVMISRPTITITTSWTLGRFGGVPVLDGTCSP
jgi:hypothetical protein